MRSTLQQWESDPLFAAVDVVENIAGRMGSTLQQWESDPLFAAADVVEDFAGSHSIKQLGPAGGAQLELKPHCKKMQNSLTDQQKLQVRKLEISDKSKGFIELLRQLTICDFLTDKEFEEQFQEISSCGDDHLVCVIEDDQRGKIIATGSVFVEKKFIINCGKVAHIEDVVVDSNARGRQLGKKIIAFLTDHARSMGCYKVILNCSAENKPFYERCGFKEKEIQMVKHFS